MKSFLAVAAGLVLALPCQVSATIIRQLSLEQMVEAADTIVVGEVVEVESAWEKRRIYTHVRIAVEQSLKGEPTAELSIRLLGGSVGDVEMIIAGQPTFKPGEKTLLFLRAQGQGQGRMHYMVGMAQGKFTVELDREGKKRVYRRFSGLSDLSGKRLVHMPARLNDRPALEEILLEIRWQLEGGQP